MLQGLVFMVTNIDEEAHGRFHLWGVTTDGRSVLVRVNDFRPYFLIAAPALQAIVSTNCAPLSSAVASDLCKWCQMAGVGLLRHACTSEHYTALQGQENNAEALTAEELDTLTHLLNR